MRLKTFETDGNDKDNGLIKGAVFVLKEGPQHTIIEKQCFCRDGTLRILTTAMAH